jgi:hypothetical protein
MKIEHTFPVDAEYVIKLRLWRNTFDLMRGMEDPHDIEIAMDGRRLTVVTVGVATTLAGWLRILGRLALSSMVASPCGSRSRRANIRSGRRRSSGAMRRGTI